MSRTAALPVAIVGAGLAGLTAAWKLTRHGISVVVHEGSGQIAGLAASYRDDEGFSHDFGAHFITNRLAAAIGISGECRDVVRYSETVLVKKRTYTYPFGLMRRGEYLAGAIAERVVPFRKRGKAQSAKEWFEQKYGAPFAKEIALPLIESWSGLPSTELAASVADSIPSSIFHTVYLKLAGRMMRRAVAIGYSRSVPEMPSVWHVYPKDGIATLCRKLAAEVGNCVELHSPVEGIFVENNRVVAVQVRGERRLVSAVVSTLPYHILGKLVSGTDLLAPLKRFRYRPMVFVNMRFERRGLLPDVVLWTPEQDFTFFRLTETPLAMPWLAPEGKTIITADIGCQVGDSIWAMNDDELGRMCLTELSSIVPEAPQHYLGCRVLRTPIAYPVFDLAYEDDRRRFAQSMGVDGLFSIGRNGQFSHIFMEDVYWRTLGAMNVLIANLGQPHLMAM
jgi:protoporphyrinogen/coproporphyrinogen III oxidase